MDTTTNRETIGPITGDYMKAHNMKTDRKEWKLAQLLGMCGDFMVLYCQYLWFLIDRT